MKKSSVFILLICLVFMLVLASCKVEVVEVPSEPVHEHEFSTSWTSDADYHWHAAICIHKDEKSDYGAHSWVIQNHSDASCTNDGYTSYKCEVCGKTKTELITSAGHVDTDSDHYCDVCEAYIPYVGGIGQAGIVFYDKGEYSDGWRYLEAAPSDVSIYAGSYKFGYYRLSSNGDNLFVNGTTVYDSENCTGTAVGTGRNNTKLLYDAMGYMSNCYSISSGSAKTDEYAARLCNGYSITVGGKTYTDWFLPSKDELELMYINLKANGLGDFTDSRYWSSSEIGDYNDTLSAWCLSFVSGTYESISFIRNNRQQNYYVRPVRAF